MVSKHWKHKWENWMAPYKRDGHYGYWQARKCSVCDMVQERSCAR